MKKQTATAPKAYPIIVNHEKRMYSFDAKDNREPPPGWTREYVAQREVVLAGYIYSPFPYSQGLSFGNITVSNV